MMIREPVFFENNNEGLDVLTEIIRSTRKRIFLVADTHTSVHCYPLLEKKINAQQLIVIPAGEKFKTPDTCMYIWKRLLESGMTRFDQLIALGGGCVSDITGFAGSVYKRGVSFIFIPTTLLSMTDAAIGGKNGVDFDGYKNLLGTINQPENVLIWPGFLLTLTERELKNGYAETLKHALIADAEFWHELRIDPSLVELEQIIERSAVIKHTIVCSDPFEQGARKLLNFGHTIGHAIESFHLKEGGDILHGEAIAAGMCIEAILSSVTGLDRTQVEIIIGRLKSVYKDKMPVIPPADALLPYLIADKKSTPGSLRFALLRRIGDAVYDVAVDIQTINKAITDFNRF
jgi:3-dehydroquinate synthase